MNASAFPVRGRTTAVAALVAAGLTGSVLVLAGCGNSPGSSSGGNANTGNSGATSPASPSGGSTSSSPSGTGSSTVSADSVPFPIAVGNTWVYKSATLAGVSSKVTDKVVSVTPASDGSKVTMANTDSLTGTTKDESYIFHSDGSISYPSSQLGTSAVIVKGGLVWPPASVIDSGQSTTSTVEMQVSTGSAKQDVTAHITVKGDGTATVTVPAGTYSTTIVQMREKYEVAGFTGTIVVKTWLANGTGPVQSEATIDFGGHSELVSHLELISFTKG
jgi:hypothetical protein